MRRLLEKAARLKASDLHLTVGAPPFVRLHGEIVLVDEPVLDADACRHLIYAMMTEEQIAQFQRDWELCFSSTVPGVGFVRITVYYQQRLVEAAVRIGREDTRSLADLGLPLALEDLTRRPNGLILITGPTGAGKTTTFNTLIDIINRERRAKIITVEDPIEHLHRNIKSIVVQQEVGSDTRSFGRALVHILRQNPDVIGIGEVRELETIGAALTAAETGHLVIATLHANDCPQTINRVVDVFPERQQQQVRYQLAMTLRGILNQRLLPRADGSGRVLVYSLLLANTAVQTMIRDNKVTQLQNVMTSGKREGMVVMDDLIRDLYQKAVIPYDTAVSQVSDPRILAGRGRLGGHPGPADDPS